MKRHSWWIQLLTSKTIMWLNLTRAFLMCVVCPQPSIQPLQWLMSWCPMEKNCPCLVLCWLQANHCCLQGYLGLKNPPLSRRRRCCLKGIHSRSDTNRTGAKGLSFYYPRLLHCLDQMLTVMSLSQHRVSSFKTVRPCAPCGARCIGHAVSTWSAVCSEAPHSQFSERARPHLCMDK